HTVRGAPARRSRYMPSLAVLVAFGIALLMAAAAFFFLGRKTGAARELDRQRAAKATAEETARRVLADAERDAEALRKTSVLSGREELLKLREEWEDEARTRRVEIEREERRITERDSTLDRRAEGIEQRDRDLQRRSSELGRKAESLDSRSAEIERLVAEERQRLEQLAGMTQAEARAALMQSIEEEAQAEAANRVRDIRETARRNAEREARRVVAIAVQRIAAEQTAELTVASVSLPSDEMKGRIIGREGRNIRAFELASGVDVIIDDTPDTVVVSCFEPVRREVARLALEKLVADGRIHPGRIEEVVSKSRKE